MGRRLLSIAAKERWRKRKAAMEVSQNEGDQNIQRASLASQNEVAEGKSHFALTTENEQSKHSQSAAFISKRKVPKVNSMIVRRSNRLKSFGLFGKRQGKEAVQHIDLTDCDRDKELHVEVEPISLKPIRGVSSSEIEVDYPVHTHVDPADCDRDTELHVEPICPEPIRNMSSSELIVDQLVPTRGKRPFASEAMPANLNYKILYTDSVKKIEALTEENYRQAQKLFYMLGKVKIYENVIAKDMVDFSNLWRPTGAATNLSDGTALNSAGAPKPTPVKRKYSLKRMKKN